jgi:hypothetical protein
MNRRIPDILVESYGSVMHLAIDFTKLTISFNVYKETEIYFPCAEMLSAGWGSQLSLKKERG